MGPNMLHTKSKGIQIITICKNKTCPAFVLCQRPDTHFSECYHVAHQIKREYYNSGSTCKQKGRAYSQSLPFEREQKHKMALVKKVVIFYIFEDPKSVVPLL